LGFSGAGSGVFTGFTQAVTHGVVGKGVLAVGFDFALQTVEGVVAVATAVGAGDQVAGVEIHAIGNYRIRYFLIQKKKR